MKNKVYGIIGLSSEYANWNAGWDVMPKSDYSDNFIASPFVLKYCTKVEWNRKHKKVMGLKTFKAGGYVRTQSEKYEQLFGKDKANVVEEGKGKEKGTKIIVEDNYLITRNNLLSCEDILNYGIVYTGVNSQSITGVVQVTGGVNKLEGSKVLESTLLTPYGDKLDSKQTTLGSRNVLDKAHFLHNFNINPQGLEEYINEGFEGYTEEAYESFKDVSLSCVSSQGSIAKNGCMNEFSIFVKAKEGMDNVLSLQNLSSYVEVYNDNKVVYDITVLCKVLESVDKYIEDIEIYYNPWTVELKGLIDNDKLKLMNIITKEQA